MLQIVLPQCDQAAAAAALKHGQGDTPHASTQLLLGYFPPAFSQSQIQPLYTRQQMLGLKSYLASSSLAYMKDLRGTGINRSVTYDLIKKNLFSGRMIACVL